MNREEKEKQILESVARDKVLKETMEQAAERDYKIVQVLANVSDGKERLYILNSHKAKSRDYIERSLKFAVLTIFDLGITAFQWYRYFHDSDKSGIVLGIIWAILSIDGIYSTAKFYKRSKEEDNIIYQVENELLNRKIK